MGIRVLHITECYEAGVRHAVDTIVDVRSRDQHILLYSGSGDPHGGFSSIERFRPTILARVLQVSAAVRKYRPDVVHLHSSWAGVYARLLPLQTPVVYQPHCFKFDDPTLPALKKQAFRAAERVLSMRTKVALTLTEHETLLASHVNPRWHRVLIPNAPTVPLRTEGAKSADGTRRRIVMVGRISSQKDPHFFAEVAQMVRARNENVEFVWVGDGDTIMKHHLHEAGVTVTGWLGSDDLIDTLDTAFCYFHSARYEGFPLSVLDAAARDLPIVVRAIPAFRGTGILQAESTEKIYEILDLLLKDPKSLSRTQGKSKALLKVMNKTRQAEALAEAYAYALGGS